MAGQCGAGDTTLTVGVGEPWRANPSQTLPVQAGLQGGHHVDVSLRVQGAFDPDSVNVQMRLLDGGLVRGRHDTADWFFLIDAQTPACDYPRARLVLEDGAGGLLPRDDVYLVADRPLTLDVRVSSALGAVQVVETVVLITDAEE